MQLKQQPKALVVGAGIVGLATARALANKGFDVHVYERSSFAVGASIRNFGMVWPIGQPSGTLYQRAMRSRSIWQSISEAGAFWHDPVGSLHLAYEEDEWTVLQELHDLFQKERGVSLLHKDALEKMAPCVATAGLKGGLFSNSEVIVDPRQAIRNLPAYLEQTAAVQFHWEQCVTAAGSNYIIAGNKRIAADLVFICSGADFETLYPEHFTNAALTKCKLQMLRMPAQPGNWRIGPASCGGLSLIHYKSFLAAPSLHSLRQRYENEFPEYIKWGIHVMVSQNREGELTVGDSHEYGLTHDPFDRAEINQLILSYLKRFARFKNEQVAETWNGVYAKSTDGATEIFLSPEPGVYILNALSGAGMTLSFGLAEEVVEKI